MINLIPPQDRKELGAARTNTLLLRYVTLLGIVIGVLLLEIVGAYAILTADKTRAESVIADNTSKTAEYQPTKQQAEAFKTNLATAKFILDKQVSYSTLVLTIANNIPEGAVLDTLALDAATFGTPASISIKTTSYKKAIDVKSSLQNIMVNEEPLFTTVKFESVANSDGKDTYPFTAIYSVTYSKAVLK